MGPVIGQEEECAGRKTRPLHKTIETLGVSQRHSLHPVSGDVKEGDAERFYATSPAELKLGNETFAHTTPPSNLVEWLTPKNVVLGGPGPGQGLGLSVR